MKSHSSKSFGILFLLLLFINSIHGQINDKTVADPDPLRYEKAIESFINWDKKNTYPDNAILFVGSSSIRLWETNRFFPDLPVINRGFGGSHISDVNFFFEKLVSKYKPKVIVFYAGDNDIAYNKQINDVYEDYTQFVNLVKKSDPETEIIYIPIKPSISRWIFWEKMQQTNQKIRNYSETNPKLHTIDMALPILNEAGQPDPSLFIEDGLHLSEKGYQLWVKILRPLLLQIYNQGD